MSEESPDVLVLGMPSSGKTVFLSVLGRSFSLVADDSDARPLGFRMRAIGRATMETVNGNFAKLRGGDWPQSTVAGRITPLKWDVFTGQRKVFTLTSMDVAGESFKKAFGEIAHEPESAADGSSAGKNAADGADGLLDMAQSDASAQKKRSTTADEAAMLLRGQIEKAKVICFFVNIASSGRGVASGRDKESILNFEEGVTNICSILEERPQVRGKALVVLTQAHLHIGEIEKAGGPAAYLGKIAPDLRQAVAEFDIPVITVSAVNELEDMSLFDAEDGSDASAGNKVPPVIESDGLFGFLLVVSGCAVAGALASVKDAYLKYLSSKMRYLQRPCRLVPDRLAVVRQYSEAGLAFREACLGYLSDGANVNAPNADVLPETVVEFYRRRTMSDEDMQSAVSGWTTRLAIDTAWDVVFRRIAVKEVCAAETGAPVEELRPVDIERMVREEAGKAKPDYADLLAPAVYGFEPEDLDAATGLGSDEDWVRKNQDAYRESLAGDLMSIKSDIDRTKEICARIDPASASFEYAKKFALKSLDDVMDEVSAINGKWPIEEYGRLPSLLADAGDMDASLRFKIENLGKQHALWQEKVKREAEEARRKQKIAEEKARKSSVRRERIKLAIWVMVFATVMCVCYGLVSSEYTSRAYREIAGHYENGEYDLACDRYKDMIDAPLFSLWKEKYFAPGFDQRVKLVEELDVRLKEVNQLGGALQSATSIADSEKIYLPQDILTSIDEALRMRDSCRDRRASVTFDSVRIGTSDTNVLDDMASEFERCAASLGKARYAVDKACSDVREKRKAKEKANEKELQSGGGSSVHATVSQKPQESNHPTADSASAPEAKLRLIAKLNGREVNAKVVKGLNSSEWKTPLDVKLKTPGASYVFAAEYVEGEITYEGEAVCKATEGFHEIVIELRPRYLYTLPGGIRGCRHCGHRLSEPERHSTSCPQCGQSLLR